MKKAVLFVALATVFGLSFMACGSKAETPEGSQNDEASQSQESSSSTEQPQSTGGENSESGS